MHKPSAVLIYSEIGPPVLVWPTTAVSSAQRTVTIDLPFLPPLARPGLFPRLAE